MTWRSFWSSNLCLQKARSSHPCRARIGQLNDAMHRAISGVIQAVFSPSGNQLIAEARKKVAQWIMVWGCLSRASHADHFAKYQLDAKLNDQGREVLDSAALWPL